MQNRNSRIVIKSLQARDVKQLTKQTTQEDQ